MNIFSKKRAISSMRYVTAISAMALISVAFPSSLLAQQEGMHGYPGEKDRPVERPHSSKESVKEVGKRAHTTHFIVVRPERLSQSRTRIPIGETPGSLSCLYHTSATNLSSGCPITGKVSSGNNNLPNPVGGSGIIAIVDAYHYPTAINDLTVFSSQFGLPILGQCSANLATSSPCFSQVFASGTQPATDASWALEASLDLQLAHAMAPSATIILVEAASNSYADLFTAVGVASNIVAANGGGEVSMSWGGSEFPGESFYDAYLQTPGVVYFAASGDTGGVVLYPSASPYVVSTGGTTINRNSLGNFVSESSWSGGGSGLSAYETRPFYQNPVMNIVGGKRGTPDVSSIANPNTGVFIYDSTPYNGSSGWWVMGGTSVATPILAGIVNLMHSFNSSSSVELGELYGICAPNGPATTCTNPNFRDVISGTSGRHRTGTGWDLATGLGSSVGLSGK